MSLHNECFEKGHMFASFTKPTYLYANLCQDQMALALSFSSPMAESHHHITLCHTFLVSSTQ